MILIKRIILLSILAITSHVVIANETSLRSYRLFNNGSFQLTVPDSWRDKTEQQLSHLPPTIVFTPLSGTAFHISISPMWAFQEDLVLPGPEDIKQLITIAAENAVDQAVENSITINKFNSALNNGFYYSATDKAPKPGEYKYMTQGMFRNGELFITFTILTNDESVNVAEEALKVFSTAVHLQND